MRALWLTTLALLMTGSLSAVTGPQNPLQPAAAELELPDQLGGVGSVSAFEGEVTVAMVVTAARLRNLKGWQRDLQELVDGVRYVLIADLPPDSTASLQRVASRLAEKVPPEVPVLIDLQRRWATELELDTARPNILLFDRDGVLVDRFHGLARNDVVTAAARRLQELLEE